MTQSLYVIRDRDTRQYWNGFGYSPDLIHAHTYENPELIKNTDWLPFSYDILELQLVESRKSIL